MKHNKLFKYILAILISVTTLLLTSCETNSPNLEQNVDARIAENQTKIAELVDFGIVTQKQADEFIKTLRTAMEKKVLSAVVVNDTNDSDVNMVETKKKVDQLAPALRHIDENKYCEIAKKMEEWYDATSVSNPKDSIGAADYGTFFDDIGKMDVYVLGTFADTTSFDALQQDIANYEKEGRSTEAYTKYLDRYFVPLKDNAGTQLQVELEEPLIEQTDRWSPTDEGDQNTFNKDFIVYGIDESNPAQPKIVPAFRLAMLEVNQEFIDIIQTIDEQKTQNYIFHKDTEDNLRLLVLNYPVSYIDKVVFKDGGYAPELKASENLYINVKEGNMLKLVGETSGMPIYENITSKGNMIYTGNITQAQQNNDYRHPETYITNESTFDGNSFTLFDKVKYKFGMNLVTESGAKFESNLNDKVEVTSGAVVLRDYMEVVRMPGVVTGEDWIITGRKLRFTRFSGLGDSVWARYIDNGGYAYKNTYYPEITLTDMLSKNSGTKDFMKNMKFLANDTIDPNSVTTVAPTLEGETSGVDNYTQKRLTNLPAIGVTGGYLTFQMPAKSGGTFANMIDLDVVDYREPGKDTDGRSIMFGVKLDVDLVETKLYNNWVVPTDTRNTLTWWNQWLSDNGFKYYLDPALMQDNFVGTYGYDDIEEGYIPFDVETLTKLQEEIKFKEDVKFATTIRTLFIGLGFLLMFYGLVLMLAWVFDINVAIGPKFLTLLTLGRWVAISYKEYDDDILKDKKFMSLKDVCVSAFIMSFIGLILTTFNGIELLGILVDVFGTVAIFILSKFF